MYEPRKVAAACRRYAEEHREAGRLDDADWWLSEANGVEGGWLPAHDIAGALLDHLEHGL